jgi:hypothetical protein
MCASTSYGERARHRHGSSARRGPTTESYADIAPGPHCSTAATPSSVDRSGGRSEIYPDVHNRLGCGKPPAPPRGAPGERIGSARARTRSRGVRTRYATACPDGAQAAGPASRRPAARPGSGVISGAVALERTGPARPDASTPADDGAPCALADGRTNQSSSPCVPRSAAAVSELGTRGIPSPRRPSAPLFGGRTPDGADDAPACSCPTASVQFARPRRRAPAADSSTIRARVGRRRRAPGHRRGDPSQPAPPEPVGQ